MATSLAPNQLEVVEHLELVLGYVFNDKTLAWEAMQRDNNGKVFLRGRTLQQNNRRLAAIGDFVIYLILCQEWYASNDVLKTWTGIRQRQTSNKFLCDIAKGQHLDSQFLVPPMGKHAKANKRIKPLATLVEAFVGAVWLDSGKDTTVTALVLVVLGIIKHEQLLSHDLGSTADARATAQESEAVELGTTGREVSETSKLEEIVAKEVGTVATQLTRIIEAGFERQSNVFEQRMKQFEAKRVQVSSVEESGRSHAAKKTFKALPGWGIAKALSLGRRIWEAKLVLRTAIRAE